MTAFDRLSAALQHQIIHTLGFRDLRPVQHLTIDAVLDGDNCIVLAPTAGGKTEAAFFPALAGSAKSPSAALCIFQGPPHVFPFSAPLRTNQKARFATAP